MRAAYIAVLLLLAVPAPALAINPPCAAFGEFLPRAVKKSLVASVDESWTIELRTFCRGYVLDDYGNAAGLTRTIANNSVLAAAIKDADPFARPDDVIYIRIVDKWITLWLHRN
jgi:hypothetical protein